MAVYTTIDNPELYFQTKLYTGDGSTSHAITLDGDENMQPDIIWTKNRGSDTNHFLLDSMRGVAKEFRTNNNNHSAGDDALMTSFDSDGFTLEESPSVNDSAETYVAWCWKAGGSGSANTVGDTSSTVSVNTTAGISMLKWTGTGSTTTVGHGLGSVPDVMITKTTGDSTGTAKGSWGVYHSGNTSAPETDYLVLDTTAATADSATYYNDTAPTSTVFTVNSDTAVNDSGDTMMAYCWSAVQGFSAMGTYTGNGDADGTFVYTGFRPALIQIKKTSGTGDWGNFDHLREGYNDEVNRLKPNGTDTEEDDNFMDILSNGFKLRVTSGSLNASGGIYVFSAWARAPFVNSNGVPCNAR